MLTIKTIIEITFDKWSKSIEPFVENNYSMENSAVVNKLPYASMYFIGIAGNSYDLEGKEGTVIPSVQIDIYTTGQNSTTKAYEIDEHSHNAMINMGYRRNEGPELIQNIDPSIKRLSSRYSRVIGYGDPL